MVGSTDRPPPSRAASDRSDRYQRRDRSGTHALPRIGPALARRIVEDRAVSGRFASVDDLDRVPGIGPRTVEAIRPHAVAR
ncbi:MAG: ComEA family DNA-binding protein [Phycisphaerales bacterium]